MHMDSLLNDSCRVAFAGLIYNLDTLFQRANLKGESPADALRSILGRAPVLEGETAPFSPQGSDEANGETLEKVVTHLQRPWCFRSCSAFSRRRPSFPAYSCFATSRAFMWSLSAGRLSSCRSIKGGFHFFGILCFHSAQLAGGNLRIACLLLKTYSFGVGRICAKKVQPAEP